MKLSDAEYFAECARLQAQAAEDLRTTGGAVSRNHKGLLIRMYQDKAAELQQEALRLQRLAVPA